MGLHSLIIRHHIGSYKDYIFAKVYSSKLNQLLYGNKKNYKAIIILFDILPFDSSGTDSSALLMVSRTFCSFLKQSQ